MILLIVSWCSSPRICEDLRLATRAGAGRFQEAWNQGARARSFSRNAFCSCTCCVWIVLGWTVTLRGPILRVLHILSILYAIVVELIPWPLCPLTRAENWLEMRAGTQPAQGPFLVCLFDSYPNLPDWLIVGGAVVVCVSILSVYLRRYLNRKLVGVW